MLTYEEYYRKCKFLYEKQCNLEQSLYDFTYKMPNFKQFGSSYKKIITNISSFLDKQYQNKDNIYDVPGQNPEKQPLIRYKTPWDIPDINALAEILVPYAEENVFGCNLYTMATYVYRTKVGKYDPKSVGSLLWHADNHPKEVIKIMVYLSNVDENSGAFEILNKENQGHKFSTTRVDHSRWSKHNSRIPEDQINSLVSSSYETKKLTGEKGTVIIFDNNIIHRATLCESKPRDVVTFMVKPTHTKIRPFISTEYTGTNYHKDVFVDPEFIGVIKK